MIAQYQALVRLTRRRAKCTPGQSATPARRRGCKLHAPPFSRGRRVPLPCKPDSVHPLRSWTAISLTPPRRSALLAQSATITRRLTGGPPFSCSVLHHARFAVPSGYPDSRWALTPPFHPCLCLAAIGGIFLLHCLSGFLTSPVPHFHEARCPVVSGLSSPPLARNCDRPGSGDPSCPGGRSIPSKSSRILSADHA